MDSTLASHPLRILGDPRAHRSSASAAASPLFRSALIYRRSALLPLRPAARSFPRAPLPAARSTSPAPASSTPPCVGQPIHWAGGQVNYYVDQGPLSGSVTNQQATAMVDAAAALWSAVPTAGVTLTDMGSLNEDVNGSNIAASIPPARSPRPPTSRPRPPTIRSPSSTTPTAPSSTPSSAPRQPARRLPEQRRLRLDGQPQPRRHHRPRSHRAQRPLRHQLQPCSR